MTNCARQNYLKAIVFMCLYVLFPSPAFAVSKCIGADGSVSYVQGNCPQLEQQREDVRVWDSGKGMTIGPGQPSVRQYTPEQQASRPTPRGSGHPCNSTSPNPVQRRLESQACSVLNGPHDAQNPACRTLATGSWKHQGKMSVPGFKALVAQCQATSAGTHTPGTTAFQRAPAAPQPGNGCFRAQIVEPVPFMGNRDELFLLGDGSVWQVVNDYQHLHSFNPQVLVCPRESQLIIKKKIIDVRRVR